MPGILNQIRLSTLSQLLRTHVQRGLLAYSQNTQNSQRGLVRGISHTVRQHHMPCSQPNYRTCEQRGLLCGE